MQSVKDRNRKPVGRGRSFSSLGFELKVKKMRQPGHNYPHVQLSEKSLRKITDRITALTELKRTPVPRPVMIR
jgi:hypothetical protein